MSTHVPITRHTPPGAWKPAMAAAQAIASPIQRILAVEAAGGIVLLVATVAALVWANLDFASYRGFFATPIGVTFDDDAFVRPLKFWIDDGLMTIFFLVVGLEIRREIFEGELATLRQSALPLAAALGGMVVPAVIYVALNNGRAGAAGWAIPMATDIAFAVGILTLLGSRVPASLRILLLALAVIDDIGAIVVIAVFYNQGLSLQGFVLFGAGLAAVLVLRSAGVRTMVFYVALGVIVWAGLYAAGIHPTLAGVLLGMLAPVRPWFGAAGFAETAQEHLPQLAAAERHEVMVSLDVIERARREAVSPVERLIHVLHPWVAFVIMPVFALANAGVVLGGAELAGDNLWVFLGIVVGLPLGKTVGIAGAVLAASKLGIAQRSRDVTPRGVLLVGMVGGIGFTMSLFIASLAFPAGPLLETAKLGILVGSGLAMIVGLALGRLGMPKPA